MHRFELEFDESFAGETLNPTRWIDHYLPHWTTPDASAARYKLSDGHLYLLIEADQPPWCSALDGDLRVSSLQTALFAGPVGSSLGTHPFDPPATVTSGPHDLRLYLPHYGRFEVRMTASDDPRLMVAFWMIGIGDTLEHTGEICIAEIFGRDVTPESAVVGVGVKRQFDPSLTQEFERIHLPLDARVFHDYAAEWLPDHIDFFIDGDLVKRVEQAIAYPMLFMLDLYEFPPEPGAAPDSRPYPKHVTVESVRGYRLTP